MTKIEFNENKGWLEVCHLISKECILLWECAGQIQVAAFRKFMADLGQFHQNEGTEHQGPMRFKSVEKRWNWTNLEDDVGRSGVEDWRAEVERIVGLGNQDEENKLGILEKIGFQPDESKLLAEVAIWPLWLDTLF